MAENLISKPKSAFSGWPMLIGWLAMLIFACHASTHMVGAGDTWVAEACGRHFVNHGVDTVEPFSANSHEAGPNEETMAKYASDLRRSVIYQEKNPAKKSKFFGLQKWWLKKAQDYPNWPDWLKNAAKTWHPTGWINQNWLTHVIFYKLTPKENQVDSGNYSFNALVYWKFVIYILTIICVYYIGRILGVDPALSAVFACFALFIGRSYFDIRPAGFSNLFVAVFLLIVVLTTYKNVLYIWLIVPLTVLWCNLHGGYIYVFIMMSVFIFIHLVGVFFNPKELFLGIGLRGVIHSIAASGAAFVGMIIFNPFHLTNLTHTFIISFSQHAKMWRAVNEWHPSFEWSNPVGTGFAYLVMFILFFGMALFWFFVRFLKPDNKDSKNTFIPTQKKQFQLRISILAVASIILFGWCTMISFSLLALDALSFFWATLFLVIVILAVFVDVKFILASVILSLLALITTQKMPGYKGNYIYPLLIIPAYVILHFIVSAISGKRPVKPVNIIFVASAAILSLLVLIIVNPFGFESRWDLAKYWVVARPWRPVYEGKGPLDRKFLFQSLYILNFLSVIFWLSAGAVKKWFISFTDTVASVNNKASDKDKDGGIKVKNDKIKASQKNIYKFSKIDLTYIIIAGLTVYMAYRSRRFIPLAGIAACPIIALFIQDIIKITAAVVNYFKTKKLAVPHMPYRLKVFFIIAGTIVTLFFGIKWTLRYKYVYLDPWPSESKLDSVFMRMTASQLKPFNVCKFMRDNKISGKMFNYWTEGGFIAWGQVPDPNTGKTPLQLFMDGRAQAAYDPVTFYKWSDLMSGGPRSVEIKTKNLKFKAEDYRRISQWLDERFKADDVWVVMMPAEQFAEPMVMSFNFHPYWKVVFKNNKQEMFVDITTPQGKKLYEGIFNNVPEIYDPNKYTTVFPDDFSKYYVLSHHYLKYAKNKTMKDVLKGFEYAKLTFEQHPSGFSFQNLIMAKNYKFIAPQVIDYITKHLEQFLQEKDSLKEESGYHDKLIAALVISEQLKTIAIKNHNQSGIKKYSELSQDLSTQRVKLIANRNW